MNQLLQQAPSPVIALRSSLLKEKQVHLFVKRDDQLFLESTPGNKAFCGNKWRKLKYNLLEAKTNGYSKLLTFGGAYSNHIAAVASAGHIFDFQTIGIIRGEEQLPLNSTLQQAVDCGMQIQYISRAQYRLKNTDSFQKDLEEKFGSFYRLPEGGTNQLAIEGCKDLAVEIQQQFSDILPDYICLPVGTGGTMAGLIAGLKGKSKVIGVSALKGNFLEREVEQIFKDYNYNNLKNWKILNDYHFGGFAKFKPELLQFINTFRRDHQIALDPLYTGKLFYAIFDQIRQDKFPPGSQILLIHTGGLQGNQGFNQRFGSLLEV